jgi:hypothetical protein
MIDVYRNYKFDGNQKAVILPYLGEFGHLVLSHLRFVHWYPAAEKIVCCQPGDECLYPSATEFFYDWTHPIPDQLRCVHGGYGISGSSTAADDDLRPVLSAKYPSLSLIRPQYDCHWHTSDGIKFSPTIIHRLPLVDIALGVRRRQFVTAKNWGHWGSVARSLQGVGLRVGLVGSRETSYDFTADAKAWDHPSGDTAGSVDLMHHCRLYVGTDTGVSHLAALMDVPSLIFRKETIGNADFRNLMERATRAFFCNLPDSSWDRPDEVLGAAIRCLTETRCTI